MRMQRTSKNTYLYVHVQPAKKMFSVWLAYVVRAGNCALCGRAVKGDKNALYALDTVFHVSCFNCNKCGK